MLIRCCDCIYSEGVSCRAIANKTDFRDCIGDDYTPNPTPNEDVKYRYALADKLHRAVLERLLDPKNVVKGEFSKNDYSLWERAEEVFYDLKYEIMNDSPYARTPEQRKQRIIEETGDVGAYLAAIIDAVGSDEN